MNQASERQEFAFQLLHSGIYDFRALFELRCSWPSSFFTTNADICPRTKQDGHSADTMLHFISSRTAAEGQGPPQSIMRQFRSDITWFLGCISVHELNWCWLEVRRGDAVRMKLPPVFEKIWTLCTLLHLLEEYEYFWWTKAGGGRQDPSFGAVFNKVTEQPTGPAIHPFILGDHGWKLLTCRC